MAPVPQEQVNNTTIADLGEDKGEEENDGENEDGDLSPEELIAWASTAMWTPETATKTPASSSEFVLGENNVPHDTDKKEKTYIEETLSPEEVSLAKQSPITEKHLEVNSRIFHRGTMSAEEEDCAGAVLIRRRSSGVPLLLSSLHRDSHIQMHGAFRARSSMLNDEEHSVLEDEEFAANEISGIMSNVINSNGERDELNSSVSQSSVPVEATLVVTTDEEPTSSEVVKAEPLWSLRHSVDSKERRRKRLIVRLLVSALLIVFAASAITTAVVRTNKEGQNNGKNETEVVVLLVESNDSASSDARGADEPLTDSSVLASYDRITHHAAIFQWNIPSRCTLEPESTSWLDEPFFMLQCGSGYGSNSSIVLYDKPTYGAKCTRRESNAVGCKTSSMVTTDSSRSESYAALVLFSCGTFSRDYTVSNTSAGHIPQTAYVRVEKTEAYCEAPVSSSDNDDEDDIQIVLSLERICRSSDSISTAPTVLPSNSCRSDESDDEVSDDLLYSLSDRACCRKHPPCQPNDNATFCDVDFDAFSAVDELGDIEECRFNSLEEREELFQNAVAKTLQAVSDLPEFELVETLIPLP